MQRCSGEALQRDRHRGRSKPYLTLTVDPEDGESELLGKYVATLQSNVRVGSNYIDGHLAYVEDYTGFSGDPKLQEGNYLALKFEAPEDATVTIQLIGGEVVRDPVALDQDMNCVLRISDPSKQKLKTVTSMTGAEDVVRIFRLSGLECDPKPEEESAGD